jgi:diguanylate cyclase (GGDEF)-like protein
VDDEQAYTDVLKAAREELLNFTSELVRKLLEQRKLIENLKRRAAHDGLTELLNYQSFQELLEKELYRAKRYGSDLCVILADIDHFKVVNDTYGHPAGDAVLKGVAACMEGALRQSDVITRYGGEEFGIIMPETAIKDAFVVTERLRRTVEALKIEYEGETISVTLSFGIASMDSEDVGKENLVRSADAALYEAKRNGRNQVCISQTKAAA